MNYDGEVAWISGAKVLTTTWTSGAAHHPSGSKNIHKTSLKGQAVGAIEGLRIDRCS